MKNNNGVFPFYYPTTVVFVDDNPHYLASIGATLAPQGAYRLFVSPDDALAFLRGRPGASVTDHCVSVFGDNPEPVTDHVIRFDLRAIARTLFYPSRFDEVSEVVVNYAMPGINGVEFCRRLADLPVKKLLFTGTADARVAVDAFNEGGIDGFLTKAEGARIDLLNDRVERLRRDYFADLSRFVDQALTYDSLEFTRSPVFVELLERLREEHGIVEYYVSNEPPGLVLVDHAGRISLLAVQSDEQMEAIRAMAVEMRVAKPLVVSMAARKRMPVFWWGERANEGDPWAWKRHLFPAQPLEGGYFYALVEGVEQRVSDEPLLSFDAYLEQRRDEQDEIVPA